MTERRDKRCACREGFVARNVEEAKTAKEITGGRIKKGGELVSSCGEDHNMITCECSVGRFLEIRFVPPVALEDLVDFAGKLARISREVKENFIGCTDFSHMNIMRPEMADRLIEILKRDNLRMERNAALLSQQRAGLRMQIERIIRESKHPGRRAFDNLLEMIPWLDEPLNDAERARLRVFLGLPITSN
jgi:hypothetical protein